LQPPVSLYSSQHIDQNPAQKAIAGPAQFVASLAVAVMHLFPVPAAFVGSPTNRGRDNAAQANA
jgi:hypothetical protein